MLALRLLAFVCLLAFDQQALARAIVRPHSTATGARDICPVKDSFNDFLNLASVSDGMSPQQEAGELREYLEKHNDLYTSGVIGPPSDTRALAALKTAREHPEWRVLERSLGASLVQVSLQFSRSFPDFRCDFPIYVTESFGTMDGAGRLVAGRPSLVLGVDSIARFESATQLPVFLTHELFHRYHFRAAGFSDDLAERDVIWRSLWAEGLATFVSARLNPSNPLRDALIFPEDLEAKANPYVRDMARQLLAHADEVDEHIYATFFEVGDSHARPPGWPPRSGYYIGYLIAEQLARGRSLNELAHMSGSDLQVEITRALHRLVARGRSSTAR